MGSGHFCDRFLPRLTVDITNCSTQSVVSCPECVRMLWMPTAPAQQPSTVWMVREGSVKVALAFTFPAEWKAMLSPF